MGFKKRPGPADSVQLAILGALQRSGDLGKKELVAQLRQRARPAVSVRKVSDGLGALIAGGWVEMHGARASAKFRAVAR